MRKVYLAGDMLNRGAQLQRAEEAEIVKSLGHQIYNPQDNKEINDKENADPEGLAERIVKHDTDAIVWSDTIVLEPLAHALGTNIELGQVKGMRDVSMQIKEIIKTAPSTSEALALINVICNQHINRDVYVHYQDIRRQGQTETGDRRSLGIHQYMYGVALDVTKGRGIQDWNQIVEAIRD